MLGKIGKYEIRKEIGRGAMGAVYEGFDTAIGRRVAIKMLRTDVFNVAQLPEVMLRFRREAQAAGGLSHPNIVTIHDYGEEAGTPYIVMEFISGSELGDLLERGSRFTLPEIVRIMTQLLGALAVAHAKGVVHRDLKPANIFLLQDRSLKVVDFGIARLESSDLTDTGTMLGTPAYMSPEQCLGAQVDYRSDLYSAGVILYQLLTGEKPFTGSVTSVIQKVLRQEPLAPSELNPMISAAWDPVVARAMAKKPEARFASTHQFADAIRAAAREEVSDASATRAPARDAEATVPIAETRAAPRPAPATKARPEQAATPAAQAPAEAKRSVLPWILALVLAGTGAYYYLVERRPPPEPVAVTSPPPPQVDEAALTRSVEERVRREFEQKAAAEKAAAAQRAAKAEAEKAAATQRAATDRAAQDREAAAKQAADRAARERAREAARAAAEKAASERAVAEKAAAERAAAKAAAEQAAVKAAAQQAAAKAAAQQAAAEEAARQAKNDSLRRQVGEAVESQSNLDGKWTGVTLLTSSIQCPAGRFNVTILNGRVTGSATWERSPKPSSLGGYVQSDETVIITVIPPEKGARASRIRFRVSGEELLGEDVESCSIGRYNIRLARQ